MRYIAESGDLNSVGSALQQPGGLTPTQQSPQQQPEPSPVQAPAQPEPTPRTDFARGEKCFNHPWRPAYARCSWCGRPFCYADLVENNKYQYCLEDLAHATEESTNIDIKPNRFTYLSSLLFLANAILILNYIYPQFLPLYSHIQSVGIGAYVMAILPHMTYSSVFIISSFSLAALALISSALVLANSGKPFFLAVVILMIMIIFFSYGYLSTTGTGAPNYLLYVTLSLAVNMLVLVLSRLGYVGITAEERMYENLEWPKAEAA